MDAIQIIAQARRNRRLKGPLAKANKTVSPHPYRMKIPMQDGETLELFAFAIRFDLFGTPKFEIRVFAENEEQAHEFFRDVLAENFANGGACL